MRWISFTSLVAGITVAGLLARAACGQDFSLAARQADFKSFVHEFEDSYAYLNRPEKPWLTWEARYADAIQEAESKQAFAVVLSSTVSELHDFHAEVRSPVPNRWLPVPTFSDIWANFQGSQAIVTAVRPGSDAQRAGIRAGDKVTGVGAGSLEKAIQDRLTPAVNQQGSWDRQWALLSVLTGRSDEARVFNVVGSDGITRRVTLAVERHVDRSEGPLMSKVLVGDVGLIRFNNSLGEQNTVAAFDTALKELRDTKGLILDLRDVPSGGDSSVALGILGRFTGRLLPYQRHRIPDYGQSDVERNWIELVAPRGPFEYKAPLVVLVDHWTGSMGEGIAIGLDAMQRGVVVGTPMAHLAGAVSEHKLPRTGVDVAYATEQIFHVDGTPRQDWVPLLLEVSDRNAKSNDPLLASALKELKNLSKRPKVKPWYIAPTQGDKE